MSHAGKLAVVLGGLLLWSSRPAAADNAAAYRLAYKFAPGQTLRWNVVHRTRVRTAVGETAQTAESTTSSVKVWRVKEVKPDGAAVFEFLVEDVDMRNQMTGQDEVRYNSRKDKEPPMGFEHVACAVGVPLAAITLDPHGKVVHREWKPVKAGAQTDSQVTIPLPTAPVAVGQSWSEPHDIEVKDDGGRVLKIKAVQRYTLEEVKTGIATIRLVTQILTPIRDPAVQSKVMQYEKAGTVRFDLDAGVIREQQTDVDKRVVGFRGEASSIHYVTRFTEELLSRPQRAATQTASAE